MPDPDPPTPTSAAAASALLVMAPGPGRRTAIAGLRRAGCRVRAAREPYEGTARFVERPARLVVLSLAGFRPRDLAFLTAARRRAPDVRILLLVPEGRRNAAIRALQAGADAYLFEPFYRDELAAIARSLLRETGGPADDLRDLGRLAGEVAHAINNPLQILSLLGESAELPESVGRGLRDEVGRIQSVVHILGRYGLLRRPNRRSGRLGEILRASLDAATQAGAIRSAGKAPHDGPAIAVDHDQVRAAFDCILAFLAARAASEPQPVAGRVRVVPAETPREVEALLRGAELHLEDESLDRLRGSVLLTEEETRRVYPGLAFAAAAARGHRGHLVSRPTKRGTALGLRLPLVG